MLNTSARHASELWHLAHDLSVARHPLVEQLGAQAKGDVHAWLGEIDAMREQLCADVLGYGVNGPSVTHPCP